MGDYRIEIRVEHKTRDQAIALIKREIERLESAKWEEVHYTSCTFGGETRYVSVGERPLTIEERLGRIELAIRNGAS